ACSTTRSAPRPEASAKANSAASRALGDSSTARTTGPVRVCLSPTTSTGHPAGDRVARTAACSVAPAGAHDGEAGGARLGPENGVRRADQDLARDHEM